MEYDFKTFSFGKGAHRTRERGMCVMEAVAYVAGEPHSDHPECACPVIGAFCRSWNDCLEDDGERSKWLAEFVWRLPGTKSTREIELQRSWMAFDWLVRTHTVAWLRLAPSLSAHAESLVELAEINDADSLAAGLQTINEARAAARAAAARTAAAADAAWDAARAAADAAARVAAADAWDAARAAWGEARAAAAGTAADAARAAPAGKELSPTKELLKQSARDLLDRMVRLTEVQEIVPAAQNKEHEKCLRPM